MKNKDLDKQSKYIRKVVLDMLAQAGRGHLASAFSITEILLVLYNHILKYRPNNPEWPNRDFFMRTSGTCHSRGGDFNRQPGSRSGGWDWHGFSRQTGQKAPQGICPYRRRGID